MANASILAAFERMWQHTVAKIDSRISSLISLPTVTTSDNGKILRVIDGEWTADTVQNAEVSRF